MIVLVSKLADVPITVACLTAFQVYRQALRDLDMLNPVWPETPIEEWAASVASYQGSAASNGTTGVNM